MSALASTPLRLLGCLLLGLSAQAGAQQEPAAEPVSNAASILIAEPPAAKAGECWTQVVIPAQFERRTETLLKTPASERRVPRPARYEWITETVTVPAGKRRVVTKAAEYEVTEEQVLVTPAGTKTIATPPKYRTVEERVPSQMGATLKPDPVTGQLCVVEGPVAWQIVKRKLIVEPAGQTQVETAARYKTVKHRKLITPAETKLVDAPERQIKKRVRKLAEPASEDVVPIPAVYEDVVQMVQTAPARNEWRSVLCETNITPALLKQVQLALRAAGHEPGRVDGRWNARSAQAVRSFQAASGLPQAGLSMETLEKLQVGVGTPPPAATDGG